jgi:glycosyltransferase involved in cell wall biosynthesis
MAEGGVPEVNARQLGTMPEISVVIPTYNSAAFLMQTLASIFRQEFVDYEIIVVDDCSSDNTEAIVAAIADPRLRYIRLPKRHGGPSGPRNVGIRAARADVIALFDSDDLMSPGRFGRELALLKANPDIGFVFTNAIKFKSESGEVLGAFLDGYDRFNSLAKRSTDIPDCSIVASADAYECLLHENYVLTCGTAVPRRIFEQVGYFDEELGNADDWDMWLRIARNFDVGFVDAIGFEYRVRGGSVSTRGALLAVNRNRVVQKQVALGLPQPLLRQARHLLSVNYSVLGYHYQSVGEFAKARGFYRMSLREKPNSFALRGLCIALLNPRLVKALRKLLRRG